MDMKQKIDGISVYELITKGYYIYVFPTWHNLGKVRLSKDGKEADVDFNISHNFEHVLLTAKNALDEMIKYH
jgi:hypothetical protein